MNFISKLRFGKSGLISAVIQDAKSLKVLTLCYMNREALRKTLKEKRIYVFRRSKGRIMLKGATSGCVQHVKALYIDCENNSLLFKVKQTKAACHEGYFSCYFTEISKNGRRIIKGKRIFNPKDVY